MLKREYNTALLNESQAFLTPYFGYCKHINYTKHFLELSHAKQDRNLKNVFLKKSYSSHKSIGERDIIEKIKNFFLNTSNKNVKNISQNFYSMGKFVKSYVMPNYDNYKKFVLNS